MAISADITPSERKEGKSKENSDPNIKSGSDQQEDTMSGRQLSHKVDPFGRSSLTPRSPEKERQIIPTVVKNAGGHM